MAIKNYRAKVKLPNGSQQEVFIQADTSMNAKAMLEAQYGKGSVTLNPMEVR